MNSVDYTIVDPRIGDTIALPEYASEGSAGLDLRACVEQTLTLQPGATELLPTGLCIHIANPGYAPVLATNTALFWATWSD